MMRRNFPGDPRPSDVRVHLESVPSDGQQRQDAVRLPRGRPRGEEQSIERESEQDADHPTGARPYRSGVPSWARFVRIRKFAEISGYTERAVYMKIARGVWLAGREYRRAPDGNICIDMEGYSQWVEGGPAPVLRR